MKRVGIRLEQKTGQTSHNGCDEDAINGNHGIRSAIGLAIGRRAVTTGTIGLVVRSRHSSIFVGASGVGTQALASD